MILLQSYVYVDLVRGSGGARFGGPPPGKKKGSAVAQWGGVGWGVKDSKIF
jgi:hypothetical protein